MFVKPSNHLVQSVLDRLAGLVAMRFMGQSYVADLAAVATNGVVQPFALNGKCARIVVGLAVNEENWLIDLLCDHQRRHSEIDIRGLPQRATLVLKSEWSERAVVGAAACDAG